MCLVLRPDILLDVTVKFFVICAVLSMMWERLGDGVAICFSLKAFSFSKGMTSSVGCPCLWLVVFTHFRYCILDGP